MLMLKPNKVITTRAKVKYTVSLLSVVGAMLGGLAVVDSASQHFQEAHECNPATEIAIQVPKKHIIGFLNGDGPRLIDINVDKVPTVAIGTLTKLNRLAAMDSVPSVVGGVYCLRTKSVARTMVANPEISNSTTTTNHPVPSGIRAKLTAAAERAGFTGNRLKVIVAIGLAEGGKPSSTCYNANRTCYSHPVPGWTSVDVGPWQINSVHRISESCARDYDCAAKFSFNLAKRTGFGAWSTYKSGAYKKFLQ